MSEEFLEREVLGRVSMNRRAFVKKFIVGAAFAVPAIASFDMLASKAGYGVGAPNGISRQALICQRKTEIRDALQNEFNNLPSTAPDALKSRLKHRIDELNAYLTSHC